MANKRTRASGIVRPVHNDQQPCRQTHATHAKTLSLTRPAFSCTLAGSQMESASIHRRSTKQCRETANQFLVTRNQACSAWKRMYLGRLSSAQLDVIPCAAGRAVLVQCAKLKFGQLLARAAHQPRRKPHTATEPAVYGCRAACHHRLPTPRCNTTAVSGFMLRNRVAQ